MKSKTIIVALLATSLLTGCTEEQQAQIMGTLAGVAVGALSGNQNNRGRNALIGGGVGLLGGTAYGSHQRGNTLQEENARLRAELERQQMQLELRRLQDENRRLRGGSTTGTGYF